MSSKILIKRGVSANLPTLQTGELGFTTDTNKLYVGNSGTNVLINNDGTAGDKGINSISVQYNTVVANDGNLTLTNSTSLCGTSFVRYDTVQKKIYIPNGIYRMRIDMNINSSNTIVTIAVMSNTINICNFRAIESTSTHIKKISGEIFFVVSNADTEISFKNTSGVAITIKNEQSTYPIYIEKIS